MSIQRRLACIAYASLLAFSTSAIAPAGVFAQTVAQSQTQEQASTLSGTVLDRANGLAVAGADVVLFRGADRAGETKTLTDGSFAFTALTPGVYHVEIRAEGYQGARSDSVAIVAGSGPAVVRALLDERAAGNTDTNLREIGRVSSSRAGSDKTLQTSTTISQTVDSSLIRSENFVRIGDALGNLPGVTLSGLSSSVGDDLGINIRGFGSSETQTLLDGHPIGPFGPGSGGFSYQDSPTFAIARSVVTYGSGALGLYGTDSIGGTVDLQTIDPTRKPELTLQQGVGNQGYDFTDVTATGTYGRLGFALVHGVEGTYGPYAPQQRLQAGLLGTDVSTANQIANTYQTAGNYLLRGDLVKLRYQFGSGTTAELTGTGAYSWDDKSGNGDNCYFPYQYQLYNAQQQVQNDPITITLPNGNAFTCTTGLPLNTNNGGQCVTPAQFAAATSGYAGGGPGPYQAHRLADLHGRLTQQYGNQLFTLDTFVNRTSTDYNRNISGGQNAAGDFLGGFDSSYYQTSGVLISDDLSFNNDDLGFGYYVQHQRITGDQFIARDLIIAPTQEYGIGNRNIFLRNDYRVNDNLSIYFNGWLKYATVTNRQTLDPRISFVFRPTPADVVRLTGGHSDGEPDPNLVQAAPTFNLTPQNITPSCGGLTNVGSVANPALLPERSNDLELAYGHRFGQDTLLQIDAYESFEANRIFGGRLPIATVPGASTDPNFLAVTYPGFLTRYASFCPGAPAPTLANLSVGTNFNASSARLQGVELNGRLRLTPQLFAEYGYDIQSVVYLGLPDSLLQSNVTLINGAQVSGIPLHKASGALDYNNRGFESRIDAFYQDANNPYYRPAFFYANATVSKTFGSGTTIAVGVQNLFNSAASVYQAFSGAPYVAENQYGTDTSAIQQQYNGNGPLQTGLLPTSFTLTLTQKVGAH